MPSFLFHPLIFGAISIIVRNSMYEIKSRNVKKKESQFTFWGFWSFAPTPARELSFLDFPLRFAAI